MDLTPNGVWFLRGGRGAQMPLLDIHVVAALVHPCTSAAPPHPRAPLPWLMAPHRNACGVEVFSEYVYVSLSSLRFPVARLVAEPVEAWDAAAIFRYWYYMQRIILS
jgi:hypothetical protein